MSLAQLSSSLFYKFSTFFVIVFAVKNGTYIGLIFLMHPFDPLGKVVILGKVVPLAFGFPDKEKDPEG